MALERKAGFTSAISTDPADTAAGLLTPDRYNLAHTVAGATVGSIPYFPTATSEASSGMTWNANGTAGEGLASAAGTATTDVKSYSATQTWNNAAVTFTAFKQDVTDTTSNAASLLMDLQVGAASKFSVKKDGSVTTAGAVNIGQGSTKALFVNPGANGAAVYQRFNASLGFTFGGAASGNEAITLENTGVFIRSSAAYRFSSSTTDSYATQSAIAQAGANSLIFGGSTITAGAASTRTEINKAVASISDNTATATFTVTVPNASHSAMLKVTLVGKIGAGGAVGAGEATGTISYDFAIARTAGVATVVGASTAYGSTTAAVAGATTITITAAASAMTGANSATQTFTVNVTIAKGGGASDNHACLCYGRLLNANASGVTIS